MINPSIKRVLVATDTSDFSVGALRFAANLQQKLGCRITVVYANEAYLPYDMFDPNLYLTVNQAEFRNDLERRLRDHVATVAGADLPYDLRLEDGYPSSVIRKTAEEIDADLIVMGTHGRTGLRRAVMGSVAERVVHESQRPVVTLSPAAAANTTIQRILCPVNFTEIAHEALDYACLLAGTLNAELLVVHVTGDLEASLDPFVYDNFSPWVKAAVRDRCRYTQLVVREGRAAEEVLKLADERKSMIVIGAQHRRFSDTTVIGTTTERVIRFAQQPVLTVIRHPQPNGAGASVKTSGTLAARP